eukprot:Rmarinus@m.192
MTEVGVLCSCLMCSSIFVTVVSVIEKSHYRGTDGKGHLEERLRQIQEKFPRDGVSCLRCPTCVQLATGMKYLEWLQSGVDCRFSLCAYHTFEDEPFAPLYFNTVKEGEGKPKWQLCQGLGTSSIIRFGAPSPLCCRPVAYDTTVCGLKLPTGLWI